MELTPEQKNQLVRRIEVAYRKDHKKFNVRLNQINPDKVRDVMKKHRIGMQCKKCLNKKGGRYCNKEHGIYYRDITDNFYGIQSPLERDSYQRENGFYKDHDVKCPECQEMGSWHGMSKDHIIPITKGGLEFDRTNIQWMHLSCNIRKYNHTKEEREEREKTKKELLKAIIPALEIAERVRRYEEAKQKRLFEAVGVLSNPTSQFLPNLKVGVSFR